MYKSSSRFDQIYAASRENFIYRTIRFTSRGVAEKLHIVNFAAYLQKDIDLYYLFTWAGPANTGEHACEISLLIQITASTGFSDKGVLDLLVNKTTLHPLQFGPGKSEGRPRARIAVRRGGGCRVRCGRVRDCPVSSDRGLVAGGHRK